MEQLITVVTSPIGFVSLFVFCFFVWVAPLVIWYRVGQMVELLSDQNDMLRGKLAEKSPDAQRPPH